MTSFIIKNMSRKTKTTQ